jgi:hypothetical protein
VGRVWGVTKLKLSKCNFLFGNYTKCENVEFVLTGGASERAFAAEFSINGIKQVLPHTEGPLCECVCVCVTWVFAAPTCCSRETQGVYQVLYPIKPTVFSLFLSLLRLLVLMCEGCVKHVYAFEFDKII